ncbi:MAG: alpha/beta fold hydrolase [Planctomycetes bacterium]|nr:alpha/beta fold hydrolase [Planctomycetota bacterium]
MSAAIIEHVPTADGAKIACKRKPAAGAPVIFVHGLAVNADVWDCPDLSGDNWRFRSLATLLHEAGYDLWLVNLRGLGRPHMYSPPPEGQTDWCVDHFILYDLPAVVDHVRRATGMRPFLIGNSMGAMTVAAWLQGAVCVGYGEAQAIVADEAAVRRRHDAAAGAVLIEFPAALRWPVGVFDGAGAFQWQDALRAWHASIAESNVPFELLSRWSWLQAALGAMGSVRLDWLRPGASAADVDPRTQGDFATRLKTVAMQWYSTNFKGATHFQAETFVHGLLRAADSMKAGVLNQLAASVRAGAFVSSLGSPPHAYSDHYDLIQAPTLVIAGGRDRIANADVTREKFFDVIASRDKTYRLFESIAHGEFEYAPAAFAQVYPEILAWIAARAAGRT